MSHTYDEIMKKLKLTEGRQLAALRTTQQQIKSIETAIKNEEQIELLEQRKK